MHERLWEALLDRLVMVGATPFFARRGWVSRREVLPGSIGGFTIALVSMVGGSAMAGAVGTGGLGELAMRYGYQRFDKTVMIAVIVVLVALVSLVQSRGTGG